MPFLKNKSVNVIACCQITTNANLILIPKGREEQLDRRVLKFIQIFIIFTETLNYLDLLHFYIKWFLDYSKNPRLN